MHGGDRAAPSLAAPRPPLRYSAAAAASGASCSRVPWLSPPSARASQAPHASQAPRPPLMAPQHPVSFLPRCARSHGGARRRRAARLAAAASRQGLFQPFSSAGKESPQRPCLPCRAQPAAQRGRLPLRRDAGGAVAGQVEPRVPGQRERGQRRRLLPAAGLRPPHRRPPPARRHPSEGPTRVAAAVPGDGGHPGRVPLEAGELHGARRPGLQR